MGDQIHPGITLKRVNPNAKQFHLTRYVYDCIGSDRTNYLNGRPEVAVYWKVDPKTKRRQKSKVVITGILKTFDEIKRLFAQRKLFGENVVIESPDYSVPRKDDASMDFLNMDLHNHLKAGQGFLPPINIFKHYFSKAFAGIEKFIPNVLFEDAAVKVDVLHKPGLVLSHGPMIAKVKASDTGKGRFQMCYEIIYATLLEALQAVCYLGNNKQFSEGQKKFFINDTDLCTFKCSFGLGQHGTLLDVQETIKHHGYIPFDKINTKVLSKEKIEALTRHCFICDKEYSLEGISADLSWIAAKCDCKASKTMYSWNGEDFFRLAVNKDARQKLNKFAVVDKTKYDDPHRLIPGQVPLYRDVKHVRRSPWAAYKASLLDTRRIMFKQRAEGTVTDAFKQGTMTRLEVQVPTTPLWSPDGMENMQRATIIPLSAEFKAESLTYAKSKSLNHIRTTVISIHCMNDVNSVVTLLAEVPNDRTINSFSKVLLIPRPVVYEKLAIERGLFDWENYLRNRDCILSTFSGFIKGADIVDQLSWESDSTCPTHNVWLLRVTTDRHIIWDTLTEKLQDSYVGVNIGVCADDKKGKSLTGRVVGILDGHDYDLPFFLQMKKVVLEIVVVVPLQFFIQDSPCSFTTWMTQPRPKVNFGDDEDSNDDDDILLEDDRVEYFEGIHVYYRDFISGLNVDSLEDILGNWEEEPVLDHSLLDFLLEPVDKVSHCPLIERNIAKKHGNEEKLKKLHNDLNPTQLQAIVRVIDCRLSVTHGPPGTGKTTTAARAIATIFLREHGLIMACAASNHAANVLYEELESINIQEELGMNIIRMVSWNLEMSTVGKNGTYLHHLIEEHDDWINDPIVQQISRKQQERGFAMLRVDERCYIRNKQVLIGKWILATADVVICTAGCAQDGRMHATLEKIPLNTILVDEASTLTVASTIPILAFNPARVAFVGDDRQLRPLINDYTAKMACMNVSFMESTKSAKYLYENNCFTLLDTQYRMCSPVALLISKLMYGGKVKSAQSVLKREYDADGTLQWYLPELTNSNMSIYTYESLEEVRFEDSHSMENLMEAKITVHLLEILAAANVDMRDVAVLAMYERQARLIRDLIVDERAPSVDVGTVDSWLGKERKYVILNNVRSNADCSIGFLKDQRRVNVALSRCIDYLFIVTHVKTLGRSKIPDVLKLLSLFAAQNVPVSVMCPVNDGVGVNERTRLAPYARVNGIKFDNHM